MDQQILQSGSCAFDVADLRAELNFFTTAAASFYLLTAEPAVIGWIDLHHPCEGHIKARLRVALPTDVTRGLSHDARVQFVQKTFAAVGIPADETYEVDFISTAEWLRIAQSVDRTGRGDRI